LWINAKTARCLATSILSTSRTSASSVLEIVWVLNYSLLEAYDVYNIFYNICTLFVK
jgi:hypothetical protein